jgi:hypothetical protein
MAQAATRVTIPKEDNFNIISNTLDRSFCFRRKSADGLSIRGATGNKAETITKKRQRDSAAVYRLFRAWRIWT